MFDIHAPLKQQRSGAFKLLALVDCGLDVVYPLAAWLDGGNTRLYTREGKLYADGLSSPCDLETVPK